MAKIEGKVGETTVLDLSDLGGFLEATFEYKKGVELFDKASITIVSEGLDAEDTTIEIFGSNRSDAGWVGLKDNQGSVITLTLPIGNDWNAIYLPDFYFAYLKVVVTRNTSTVGTVELTTR